MNYLEELESLRKKVWAKTIISFLSITLLLIIILVSSSSSGSADELGKIFIIVIVFGILCIELITNKTFITLLLIIILVSSSSSSSTDEFGSFFIIVIVFGTLLTKLITNKNVREYKKIYKQNITLETFKCVFTDVDYSPNLGLPESVISSTKMMNTGDRYHSNDYISAKYKEINFECADVYIEKKYRDKDGHTHYITIFKGQWLIFDFNKTFKANVQICEKSFRGDKRGDLFSDEVYEKVKMEDVDFNKTFKIYAENEIDAFYVLTPNMMEKIKKLNNELHGNLLFCLINSKMHIGLHNSKDLFEPNVYKKINLEEEKQRILKDIKIITEFVDILDLDNDLFKRRW